MAYKTKFLHYATQAKFDTDLGGGLIDSRSVVFIQDTKRVWTHNNFFDTLWPYVGGKPTTLAGYGITDAQPKSTSLTNIAALSGTAGYLKKTGADTWALDTNVAVQSDITSAINNIQIGGRNLLKDTNRRIENSNYPLVTFYLGNDKPLEGEQVTIAFKGELGEGKSYFGIYNSGGSISPVSIYPSDKGSDGIFRKTFSWKILSSSNTFINIYPIPNTVVVTSWVEDVMLVRGNKISYYAEAPEDIDASINQVQNNLNTHTTNTSNPHNVTFALLQNKPNTIAGYGITDGITGTGIANYLPKFTGASSIGNSVIYESGGNIGIGTTSPSAKLDVAGSIVSIAPMINGTTAAFTNPHLALKASNTVDNTGFVGMTFATSTTNNYGYSLGALRSTNGGGDLVVRRHHNNETGTEVFRINSSGTVTASTFSGSLSGNASTASKLGTVNVGSNTNPIYLSSGTATASTYSFGNNNGNIPINNGTLNTNLNADLLDGLDSSRYLNTKGAKNYVTFTVGGDANTYYPVVISAPSSYYPSEIINITRGYNESAPDTWNTSTHRGGLTLCILWNGSSYWDGNGSGSWNLMNVLAHYETYATIVGGMSTSTLGLVLWLRGGGAVYHCFSNSGTSQIVTVYLDGLTDSASRTFSPITTISSLDTFKYLPIRVDSATKLQTPRTIWGQSFDGTANVSGAISGATTIAASTSVTAPTFVGALSGNATSATKLQTARTIAGVSFDGTANIAIPFANLANKPTTLVGYGITDAPTKTGTGASGTWNIDITGSAANATNISNGGTVTLASATESNSITITQPSYVSGNPVKLLNFNWYATSWSLGNIRGGSTDTLGLGIYLNSTEIGRFTSSGWSGNSSTATTSTTAINLKSNATTGVMQIVGPAASTTRVMTIPDQSFNVAAINIGQTYSATNTFTVEQYFNNGIRVNQTVGTGIGISLYGSSASNPIYGMMFATTASKGTHGSVNGDWATYFTMNTTAGRGWIFTTNASDTTGNIVSISNTGNITSNGTITSSAFYQSSDERLKDIISSIDISIKDIENIPIFYFKFKDNKENRIEIGTSAQKVQKVFPELVIEDKKTGYLSVQYDKFGLIALELIKKQQIEINNLRNEINVLKNGYRN